MELHSADNLRVYRDREASVVVLEYEVHGTSVQTGRPYDNRFVSVVTIKDRKVTHWRDYLDPVAVFDASGWPGRAATLVSAGLGIRQCMEMLVTGRDTGNRW
jgi:hypothetical protein